MPRHGQRTAEEAKAAGSEAFKGAVVGAAKVIEVFPRILVRRQDIALLYLVHIVLPSSNML